MIRATTPKHIFAFKTDPSEFSRILVTYEQDGRIILEKTEEDMTFEPKGEHDTEYIAWCRLTQEETSRFKPRMTYYGIRSEMHTKVLVQIRVLTSSGESLASDTFQVDVEDVLNDEVLQ